VVRLAPQLMAGARRGARTRGSLIRSTRWRSLARRCAKAQTIQVVVARDMIRRISELTRATKDLYQQIADLVKQVAQILPEPGIGVLLAAKFIGEIAGIDRFTSDAQLARLAGCAPIPVSSGPTDRYRLTPAATDGSPPHLDSPVLALAVGESRTLLANYARSAIAPARVRAGGRPEDEGRSAALPMVHAYDADADIETWDLWDDSRPSVARTLANAPASRARRTSTRLVATLGVAG
jgi:transposase